MGVPPQQTQHNVWFDGLNRPAPQQYIDVRFLFCGIDKKLICISAKNIVFLLKDHCGNKINQQY